MRENQHFFFQTRNLKPPIMSRFVKRLDKMTPALREQALRARDKYALPTLSNTRYIPQHERKTTIEEIGIGNGDLIYITEGKHKGKITKVSDYSSRHGTFATHDIAKTIIIPQSVWSENQRSHIAQAPDGIPEEHVKLAARDRDEDGNIVHLVADEIVYKDHYYDERYKRWMPKRFIKHHENIEIPWPNPEDNHTASNVSTREEVAHLKTYEIQTIAKPLLPEGVINELRNPYSRHKKRALSDIEARRLNEPAMPLTAEQKIYLAKKAKEPVKKLEPLAEEVKDYIGQRMAEHLSKIDNPYLLAHLDALSKVQIPDFKKTMEKIEESQRSNSQ